MNLTEREQKILTEIVKSYIASAKPISSESICQKSNIGVSSATIRNEMEILAKEGYIYKPYSSAGRTPTDKGYRFWVNNIFNKFKSNRDKILKSYQKYFEPIQNIDNLMIESQLIIKKIAELSSNLSLFYSRGKKIIYKEGWEGVIQKPEFQNNSLTYDFFKSIKYIESEIDNFMPNEKSNIRIYIGKETNIPKCNNFSLIVAGYSTQGKKEEGLIAIIGPKRMRYNKNIPLVNLASDLLEEIK